VETVLVLLFAFVFLFIVFKPFSATPDPERIVIIIPEDRPATGSNTLLLLLLALIGALILYGQ
jgi:hypothetical protein